ncbi:hypothetical protein MWU75_18455 [Ornithinimicrobium sp. F0845]|uniref:baeRF11 domain-containing protein n=1 Tax=Ornithinimicrobium sp. F0845 TaxID=2926412 RepID=UPI001FF511FA|nr:hypothetical protein [Ornithinimicrobium sp. F0845]MCK0114126.1 hypothetical protein [Ornithinimicrobium sp. F0845]
MTTHHELPTSDDLDLLSARTEHALSIYLPTSPSPQERNVAQATVKSAFDEAARRLKEDGATHGLIESLRRQWQAVDEDSELWGKLSSSLAIFLAPEVNEVFVLPNKLEPQSQLSDHFDLGQLLRSVTYPHEAYALTLSANSWQLWHATADARIAPLELEGDYPTDAADATNRETIRGRDKNRGLVGDEGKKALLDKYAHRVAEAVTTELNRRRVRADTPFFLFAAEPLLSQFTDRFDREVIQVQGAAERVGADQLDDQVRQGLDRHFAERVNTRMARIADTVSSGLVATDLVDISKAATRGLVDTLLFNFTVDVYGRIDEVSGALERVADGERFLPDGATAYDLLSQLAVRVLRQGGTVLAVRDDEVSHELWNSLAVAQLRGPLG